MQIVNVVNMEFHCNSMYGHLVDDIKNGLQGLDHASFTHVRRAANVAAHELAIEARTHVTDTIS